jgi:hypothetical protein
MFEKIIKHGENFKFVSKFQNEFTKIQNILLDILRSFFPNKTKASSILSSNSVIKESDILINQIIDPLNELKDNVNQIIKTEKIEMSNLLHENSEITQNNIN